MQANQLDPNMKAKGVIRAAIAELQPEEQTQPTSLEAMKDKLTFIAIFRSCIKVYIYIFIPLHLFMNVNMKTY